MQGKKVIKVEVVTDHQYAALAYCIDGTRVYLDLMSANGLLIDCTCKVDRVLLYIEPDSETQRELAGVFN
jgi:hypothetical protein